MTNGKTTALTRWTFVGNVMSLLFNLLSRLVITFLLRSKCLLISWLQSPPAVILEPPENKVWHCFHCFPIYLPWSYGTRCHSVFWMLSFRPTFSLSSFIWPPLNPTPFLAHEVSTSYRSLLLPPACRQAFPAFAKLSLNLTVSSCHQLSVLPCPIHFLTEGTACTDSDLMYPDILLLLFLAAWHAGS